MVASAFFVVLVLALSVSAAAAAATVKARPRVRHEVRSLTDSQWQRVVAAIKVMKFTDEGEGKNKYGLFFRSYDSLVAQHATAAVDIHGDAAHFQPVFPIFHRAWCLIFENSLIAIDPLIVGLPYWDFSLDLPTSTDDGVMAAATVFSPKYFGGSGNPAEGYAVTDGPFAYWPILNDVSRVGLSFSSPYGLLRSPVSVNNSPFLTRRLFSLCGVAFGFGDPNAYGDCQAISVPDISAYRQCIDPTLHGPAHLAIGGSWKRDSQKGQPDSLNCAQWIGQIRPQPDNKTGPLSPSFQLGSFINAWSVGCITCPDDAHKCGLEENPDSCVCVRTDPAPKSCGPLWTNLIDAPQDWRVSLAPCTDQQLIGDMVDSTTSPNDPIFPFHHSNIDRAFTHWTSQFLPETLDVVDYFNYPKRGYGLGGNLDDVLNPSWPLSNVVEGWFPGDDPSNPRPWTVRDVIEATYPHSPYRYQEQGPYPPVTGLHPTPRPQARPRAARAAGAAPKAVGKVARALEDAEVAEPRLLRGDGHHQSAPGPLQDETGGTREAVAFFFLVVMPFSLIALAGLLWPGGHRSPKTQAEESAKPPTAKADTDAPKAATNKST